MTNAFIGIAAIALGTVVMWIGTILQLSDNPAKADDARILLGAGVGMLLAGCWFACAASFVAPEVVTVLAQAH